MSQSNSTKKTFDIVIGGMSYKLRSVHDEETVQELAQLVDQRIQQAIVALKSGSFQSAAVLAALNIAEELVLLKKRALKELDRIEERALKISQDLESSKQPTKAVKEVNA
jgi:cell division protein ZapA